MDDIISDAQLRRSKARRRVGPGAQCSICGEDDPRYLELHHLAGQAYDEAVVPVCRNCHRKLSDDQIDHPNTDSPERNHVLARLLMGIGDLLVALGRELKQIGQELFDMAPAPRAEGDQ